MRLPLTKGQFATVDDDCPVAHLKWYAGWSRCTRTYYAQRNGGGNRTVLLHRAVMDAAGVDSAGFEIDHVNGDTLDNRLANLRLASRPENRRNRGLQRNNTTGFKGVSRDRSKFRAQIVAGGTKRARTFATAEEAAAAYDEWARELHGSFARPNHTEQL